MIRLKVSGLNFESIIQQVQALAFPDLGPLAQTLRDVMLADNSDGLEAGLDIYGDPMEPVKDSTRKTRGGDGPPLIPNYGASRAISDYQVEIQELTDRTILIGSWPSSPFIRFHRMGYAVQTKTGAVGVPSRDPVGIRPDGQEKIAAALEAFALSLVGGRT